MRNNGTLPWQHIHILGMGGTGLSAIARVLLGLGYTVSGCDRQESPTLRALAEMGAAVHVGHDAGHVHTADALLVTSAAPPDHPEVLAARKRGVPVFKRREFLPHLPAGREVIAVAGTHGKTTTTGMIVHMVRSAALDVGYIVGSTLPRWDNGAAGSEPAFVIEADEYDYMFWGLAPAVGVITNVEWDHVDCFPTREAYLQAFRGFAERARRALVVCAEDAGAMAAAQVANVPVVTYALREGADWHADVFDTTRGGGFRFRPYFQGQPVADTITLRVPGNHNLLNALAALAALHAAGFDVGRLAPHLETYRGAGRRFQHQGEVAGITVVDDYAHHPTEVRATLAAARMAFPGRRVWAVFQPHTYSRTRALLDAWRRAFADADRVVVMDIYAAREQDTLGLSGEQVAAAIAHPSVQFGGDVVQTAALLARQVRPGDVVITLGAGTSIQVGQHLLAMLREQHGELSNTVAEGEDVS